MIGSTCNLDLKQNGCNCKHSIEVNGPYHTRILLEKIDILTTQVSDSFFGLVIGGECNETTNCSSCVQGLCSLLFH